MNGDLTQDIKNASNTHMFKQKKKRSQRENHRDILLPYITENILARVVIKSLTNRIFNEAHPMLQCGFRKGRGIADMIFAKGLIQ